MNVAIDAPKRPALKYYGGKWDLAPWIIRHFPKHDNYLEPCFGAGSVLLRKGASEVETANDLNGRVVNFFRVLRDEPEKLISLIELTPWALDEFCYCQEFSSDAVEDARRFFVTCWMSIHGGPLISSGWRYAKSPASRRGTPPPNDLIFHDLHAIASRLRHAQFTNTDALKLIDRYRDIDDVLIFFDPPYLKETRSAKDRYAAFEVGIDWHIEAAELLRACDGYVVISGYSSELYRNIYEDFGWVRVDNDPAQTNSGGKRIESLWLNPATVEALATEAHERECEALPLLAYANTRASEPAL